MKNRDRRETCGRLLTVAATWAAALAAVGCAGTSTGIAQRGFAGAHTIPSDKIFLGNDTVTIRGVSSRKLDRYTCGSRGIMVCDRVASLAQCSCYRK